MPIAQTLLPELDQEMATTRKLLERVPGERAEWKPHEKSFSLGHLGLLVAGMPNWLVSMFGATELDLTKFPGYSIQPTDVLLRIFDDGVARGREALAKAKDEDFDVSWSLKRGAQVLFTLPRYTVVRQHINHMVHHRGQLSVYLRLLDVPLPQMYGPTADEK